MKMRILFVDDEPLVLQGLQRMLHSMHQEWEMEFFESAGKALERMKETSFDVVLSDVRMPGMNGADFLNEVMKAYPQTIRFILSGHIDPKLIFKCIGSTHQVLSKPCDPNALKEAVLRVLKLRKALQSDKLKEVVGRMDRLPSIPTLYVELVEMMRDPRVSIENVGAVIGKDMAMTAKVLKLVNSAFFGIQRRVVSTADAVSYLGVEMIRSLVLSIHAFSQFESVEQEGFCVEVLWSHSLRTAAAAKAIARMEGADKLLYEDAFTAGMLHDVGKLVLAANFPERYRDVFHLKNFNQVDCSTAEDQVFGANHADVGGYLLGLWGLPVPVVNAIALHHAPDSLGQKLFSPLTAVHAANAMVHRMHGEEASPEATLNMDYLGELGLAERPSHWIETLRKKLAKQPVW